ncbi:MAG: (E)-4-hydroxy-3-methylbut-2-enyl-diphosphate synthase [Planctomycetes bacterium]|nr:(E)-4-hydroxy-3-methylbut-2-enyl-diphosphate synthase [Planctomycetota bacterium]
MSHSAEPPYLANRFAPRRRQTRVVMVGDVAVGGDQPIRVQSMTTTFTKDAEATLEQIAALDAAGCEIIRVTVPTLRDAQALPEIRAGMAERGIKRPLVADIHFSPKLAMLAVEHVEKVRINPGNFTDSKRFAVREYSDLEYQEELERIEATFTPLVLRAKERGVSLRIGTNHGSLSDRIMNRYGDSPLGMVESALEFVRICERHDFHELILSMKASNTQVMIQAYRLLAARMAAEGMDYPFHLGVTEAGGGDDARIKSSIGIGGLLADGIGDTIRVSLTEDPVAEVPVGCRIAERGGPALSIVPEGPSGEEAAEFYSFERRTTRRLEQGPASAALGEQQSLRVELRLDRASELSEAQLVEVERLAGPEAGERRLEVVELGLEDPRDLEAACALRERLGAADLGVAVRASESLWSQAEVRERLAGFDRVELCRLSPERAAEVVEPFLAADEVTLLLCGEVEAEPAAAAARVVAVAEALVARGFERLLVTVTPGSAEGPLTTCWVRALASALDSAQLDLPLLLSALGGEDEIGLLRAATDLGASLVDGLGDAVRLLGTSPARAVDLGYGILQGGRRRTTKTEYISCPGCGRTLFELEPVTERIQAKTSHLKGVKIAVMGCIVNGPGEMADADFGYVGWKPGKVNLYVGKECVVRSVDEDEAPDRLVDLIKEHGRWCEPDPAARQPTALPTV